jgi:DNA-binding MarR family transcriptional regulator
MEPTDATQQMELELMLLSRHTIDGAPGAKPSGRRLDRSAYVILSRLEAEGPMSIPQLQSAFGLDSSTLNRQTTAMLRAGSVERIADPDGGVARKFRMTPDGAARLAADREEIYASLATVVEDWEPTELAAFTAMLRRFNESIERLGDKPWPRGRTVAPATRSSTTTAAP